MENSKLVDRDGSPDSLLVECRSRDRKVAGSIPAGTAGEFSSPVLTLKFGVRSTPVLPYWHVKDSGHSAKSAGGRLHLNIHTRSEWFKTHKRTLFH